MGNGLKPCKQQQQTSFLYEPLISTPLLEEAEKENLRVFSVKELKKATKQFKKERVVKGEDTYVQTFYKGYINETSPSRTKIKIPVSVMEGLLYSQHGLEEWKISKEEAESLGEISHPNLVKLLGYCCEDSRSLLVFEYLQKESLDHCIFEKKEALSWEARVKIAIGIAEGNLGMETDVYTFGVILLELFTGSKEMVKNLKRLKATSFLFTETIDPRLGSDYPVDAATKMGTLIQRCTMYDWEKRPLMQQVLDVLNSIVQIQY